MAHIRRFRVRRRRQDLRIFRERFDVNSMTDEELRQRFRFSLPSIMFILGVIRNRLQNACNRSRAVPPLLQLLVALRFFATGSFFRLVGDSVGLSEATVCRCVWRVAQALASVVKRFIRFPEGNYATVVQQKFFEISGFPNVVGAIDCTQVRIQAPHENEADFVNRKGFHSLNVQMTCDSNYRITSCVANWPGSVHDARIFRNSKLCQNFERGDYEGLLLGDSGYPCRPFLMKPFHLPSIDKETSFNRSLCRARVLIEQTFGILKKRFPCLHIGLRVSPTRAAYIVLACVVLHNIATGRFEPVDVRHDDDDDDHGIDDDDDDDDQCSGANDSTVCQGNDGAAIRRYLCQQYF